MLRENLRHIFSSISISKFPPQIFHVLLQFHSFLFLFFFFWLISYQIMAIFWASKQFQFLCIAEREHHLLLKWDENSVKEGKLEDKRNLSLMLSHCIKISFKIMLQTSKKKSARSWGRGSMSFHKKRVLHYSSDAAMREKISGCWDLDLSASL